MDVLILNRKVPENVRRPVSWLMYIASSSCASVYAAVSYAQLWGSGGELVEGIGRLLVLVLLLLGAWVGFRRARQYPTLKYLALQLCHVLISGVVALSVTDMFDARTHWYLMLAILIAMGGITIQMGEAHKGG